MSINSKDLVLKLLKRQVVKVENSNKEIFEFEIQKVSVETFAGEYGSKPEYIVGKTQEQIAQMYMDNFKKEDISKLIAPVLLEGVVSPKVVNKSIEECDMDKEVPLKVLLIDLIFATNLYVAILNISLPKDNK